MSEHHLHPRGIRWDRIRVRPVMAAALALALVGTLTTACAPVPSPPAVCPGRTEVPLEPADPVHYSLPRAVSPDGGWLVTSRVSGAGMDLSLRRTLTDGTSTPVGSLPYAQVASGTLLVSVPADGSQVVFGTAGTAATEDAPQTTLRRWGSDTGAVSDIPVPVIASPPPGVAYPVNAFAVSADGQRVLWQQSYREGPEPYVWHRVLIVTDAATDAVLSASTTDAFAPGWITDDGATGLDGNQLVDTATGVVTDLSGVVAAAQAAFPGTQLQVGGISDDLRHLALRRYDPTVVPGLWTYLAWDMVTGTGRVALQLPTTGQAGQPQLLLNAVTVGGSLLFTQWSSPPNLAEVVESHPTAGIRSLVTSATQLTPQYSWLVTTSDARTVVISRQTIVGPQLVAERCV